LRLALYHHKRTLHAVQLIFLGSKYKKNTNSIGY
jgi:hypothetical protein